MRKAATDIETCIARGFTHTHIAQPCQGHGAKARHAAHAQEKLPGRGVFTGHLLTSQQGKTPKTSTMGKGAKGVMSPEALTHLSQDSLGGS